MLHSAFNQEYIWRDEAANLLIEESDVMIRLFQGINKAMMDYEKYKQDIAEGYTTLEKVKVRRLLTVSCSFHVTHGICLTSLIIGIANAKRGKVMFSQASVCSRRRGNIKCII